MKKWLLALMICLSFASLTAGLFLLPKYIDISQSQNQKPEEDVPIHGSSHLYGKVYKYVANAQTGTTEIASGGGSIKIEHTDQNARYVNGTTYEASASETVNGVTTSGGDGHWEDKRGFNVIVTPSYGFYVSKIQIGDDTSFYDSSHTSTTTKTYDQSGLGWYGEVTKNIYIDFGRRTTTVTFNVNGGSAGVGTSTSYAGYGYYVPNKTSNSSESIRFGQKVFYDSVAGAHTGFSKTGYTFSSVSFNRSGSKGTEYSGANTVYYFYLTSYYSTLTCTVNWTANRYAVTLNPNGATGDMTSNKTIYALYNSSTLYSSSSGSTTASWTNPTKTGYTFGGWTTGQNSGSVVINTSKALVANISGYTNSSRYWTKAGSATLYAKWTINSYTLTANANGGTIPSTSGWNVASGGGTATKSVTYGNTYGTLPTPTRANYSFSGWYTASSGGTRVYTSTTMGAGNQYIYAHWTFAVEVHFITEGPGDFVDNGCIYSWDTSGNNELVVYFDYNDDIDISWDGLDMAYINIHGGDGGSFEISTAYYFTGEVEVDFDDTVQDYNLDNGISFCCGDSALNHIYVYFYTYKYVNIGRNNTSYGTVSQSQVRVNGSTTYSISSSGSTVTINGTSVTATPVASTTGFTYTFGSWTIPSGYASQSFPTITANFTRTVNTRSVTLAVRTISKSGGVSSSNAIPSGASLAVSYTNSTPSSTSSSQTSASTAYTIQAGTSMTITPTVPAGYKYVGYNTSASKPSVSSFPTSSTITPSNGSTYYFFFQEVAAPLYYTTERGGYWYYEDGEYPQTYVGTSLSGTSATSSKFNINGTDYTVYTANGLKYIQVASPMTGTIKFNGTTVSLTKGTKYWFRIDPIRWRVSHYGAASNKYSLSSVTANLVGVSDILGHGRVNTNEAVTYTDNLTNYTQPCSAVGYTNYSASIPINMETYTEGSTPKMTKTATTLSQTNSQGITRLNVANLDLIQTAAHNGTSQDNLKTYASDLSAMLQCRDYNNSTGWTSSIYNIGSGIVVGPGASYMGKYWAKTDNVFGFVYAHQASYATCLGTR